MNALRHIAVLEFLPLLFIKHVELASFIHRLYRRLLNAITNVKNIAKETMAFLAYIVHIAYTTIDQ